MIPEYPGERQLHGVAIGHRVEERTARMRGRPGRDNQDVAGERIALQPVVPGGIGQVDLHPVLGRLLVAEFTEPGRHSRAAAGDIDHEVSEQRLRLAALLAALYPYPGDPRVVRRGRQAHDVVPLKDANVGDGQDVLADVLLEYRAAARQAGQARVGPGEALAVEVPLD